MPPIRFALAGCGLMGARHLRGHAELECAQPGTIDLLAVCDADHARAEAVAAEAEELLGKRPAVLTRLDQIAGSGAVAVDVVTPNRSHDAAVIELLEAGLHVLVEKPFAVTIARGRRMLDAAQRTGRILGVAENNRRDPMNRLARAVIDAGVLGPLHFASTVNYNRGGGIVGTPWRHRLGMGGVILDVCIHLAYGLEILAGPLDRVAAVGDLVQKQRAWKQPDGRVEMVDCEAVDTVSAALTFANGATGIWSTHFASSGVTRFERLVMGSEGTLETAGDRSGRGLTVRLGDRLVQAGDVPGLVPDWRLSELEAALFGERAGTYQLEFQVTDRKLIAAEVGDFAAAVRDGRPPEVQGELGLRSVAIIYALLESLHAGRPVSVTEVLSGEVHAYQDMVEAAV